MTTWKMMKKSSENSEVLFSRKPHALTRNIRPGFFQVVSVSCSSAWAVIKIDASPAFNIFHTGSALSWAELTSTFQFFCSLFLNFPTFLFFLFALPLFHALAQLTSLRSQFHVDVFFLSRFNSLVPSPSRCLAPFTAGWSVRATSNNSSSSDGWRKILVGVWMSNNGKISQSIKIIHAHEKLTLNSFLLMPSIFTCDWWRERRESSLIYSRKSYEFSSSS